MVIWTLARKDLRLLVRDPRALIILVAMPLIFILVLGPHFSRRVARCSFLSPGWKNAFGMAATVPAPGNPVALAVRGLYDENQDGLPLYLFDGLNPFHREGVNLPVLDVEVLRDET